MSKPLDNNISWRRTIRVCPKLLEIDQRFGQDNAHEKYPPARSEHHDDNKENGGHHKNCGCLIDWEGHDVDVHIWHEDRLDDTIMDRFKETAQNTKCQLCGSILVVSDGHRYEEHIKI